MARTFAIGDIHGCHAMLQALLTVIDPQHDDTLIFLGDYIDRGEDSKRVLDTIMYYQKVCHVVTILGNHEEMMLASLTEKEYLTSWLKWGGAETLESFNELPTLQGLQNIPHDYFRFLKACVPYHETDKFIFTHATPFADKPMSAQSDEGLRWRNIPAQNTRHYSKKTIICGHTTQHSGDVLCIEGLIGIDTYAYGSGHLTALEVNTMVAWQANHQLEVEQVDLSAMVEFMV